MRSSRDEDLLLALRERQHGDPRQVERRVDRLERGGELPLPAIDHDQVRDRREAFVEAIGRRSVPQAREAPRDHLPIAAKSS